MLTHKNWYCRTRYCTQHDTAMITPASWASIPWWRHQMETFSALLAICAGNSPVPGEFPAQRPVTRSFDVFFDLRLNKRLSKQSSGWWFEMLSCPLWRHCNAVSGRTSYRKLSRRLEASRFGVILFLISLIFDRLLDSSATDLSVKFQSNTTIITFNLAPSRLHGIWW